MFLKKKMLQRHAYGVMNMSKAHCAIHVAILPCVMDAPTRAQFAQSVTRRWNK